MARSLRASPLEQLCDDMWKISGQESYHRLASWSFVAVPWEAKKVLQTRLQEHQIVQDERYYMLSCLGDIVLAVGDQHYALVYRAWKEDLGKYGLQLQEQKTCVYTWAAEMTQIMWTCVVDIMEWPVVGTSDSRYPVFANDPWWPCTAMEQWAIDRLTFHMDADPWSVLEMTEHELLTPGHRQAARSWRCAIYARKVPVDLGRTCCSLSAT